MEFQFHEISLSAGQPVMTLCRKPPIMKLAVVADPETERQLWVKLGSLATQSRGPLCPYQRTSSARRDTSDSRGARSACDPANLDAHRQYIAKAGSRLTRLTPLKTRS